MMAKLIPLEHPGTILKEEFLIPLNLSNYAVAQGTGISNTAMGEIIKGKRTISFRNCLRFARFFGLSDDYFAKIQLQYDLDRTREMEKKSLRKIKRFRTNTEKRSNP